MSRYVKNCKVSKISAPISYSAINVLTFIDKKHETFFEYSADC